MRGILPERFHHHGYISADGLILCGGCVCDHQCRATTAFEAVRLDEAHYQPFNPEEGDDWCSVCGENVTARWPEQTIARVEERARKEAQ